MKKGAIVLWAIVASVWVVIVFEVPDAIARQMCLAFLAFLGSWLLILLVRRRGSIATRVFCVGMLLVMVTCIVRAMVREASINQWYELIIQADKSQDLSRVAEVAMLWRAVILLTPACAFVALIPIAMRWVFIRIQALADRKLEEIRVESTQDANLD